jgi:hypothetical protein
VALVVALTSAAVVVALVVALTSAAVVVSMAARSAVAYPSQAELVPAEAASVLAPCAPRAAFQTLLAQDPGSRHSGDHHRGSLCTTDDPLDP